MIAGFLIGAAWVGLSLYVIPQRRSPDSKYYFGLARGERQPIPFHFRWLLPKLLRENITAWKIVTGTSLVITAGLVGMLGGWFAALLFIGLPITRTLILYPALVDAPALACAAGAAVLAAHDMTTLAVVVACAGATIKEQTPIFAAIAAWNPWLLIALLVPLARYVLVKRGKPDHSNLTNPFSYARVKQAPRLLDPTKTVLPWGVCLAALWSATPQLGVALAAGYLMLSFVADSTRCFQWSAIPVCVVAASAVPEALFVPLAAVHLFNPFHGEL